MSEDLFDFSAAKRAVEDAASPPPSLIGRSTSISVEYVPPGSTIQHVESLTSVILDADSRIMRARLAAKMAGGTPWDRLPPVQGARFWALATLEYALETPPQWAVDAWRIDDTLLFELYRAVEVHEQRFFRRDEGSSEDGQGGSVVVRLPGEAS